MDRSVSRSAGEAGYEPLTRSRAVRARRRPAQRARGGAHRAAEPAAPSGPRCRSARLPSPIRSPSASRLPASPTEPPFRPTFSQALLREESALDPRALSPTGALGLTQLMPATARMVARKLKVNSSQTSTGCSSPSSNIRLGGTYLGELYARFQHPALALASYNAGPGAVSGWLRARGSLPLDAFVEESRSTRRADTSSAVCAASPRTSSSTQRAYPGAGADAGRPVELGLPQRA